MIHHLYCPLCNAQMMAPGRYPIVTTGPPREYYLGVVIVRINCAGVTELNPDNGDLAEFGVWRLSNLIEVDNCMDMPLTEQSLGFSMLYKGKES